MKFFPQVVMVLGAAILVLTGSSNQHIWKRQYPTDEKFRTYVSPEMETMERNLMVWLQKSMEQKVMAKFNADMEKKLQSPDEAIENPEGQVNTTASRSSTEFGKSSRISSQIGDAQPKSNPVIVSQAPYIGKQTRSSLPTQDSSLDTDQIFSPVPEPPSGMINLSSGVTQLPASYYSPYHRQMYNNYPFQTDETAIRGPPTQGPTLRFLERLAQSAESGGKLLHGSQVTESPCALKEKDNERWSCTPLTGQDSPHKPYRETDPNQDKYLTDLSSPGLSDLQQSGQFEASLTTVSTIAKSIGDSGDMVNVPVEEEWQVYRRNKMKVLLTATEPLSSKTTLSGRQLRRLDSLSALGSVGKVTSFHYL